jgi:hypothetical protein
MAECLTENILCKTSYLCGLVAGIYMPQKNKQHKGSINHKIKIN